MKKTVFFTRLQLFLLLVSTVTASHSAHSQVAKKVYSVGNSLTHNINHHGLQNLAEIHGNSLTWGLQIIGGASLESLWQHRNGGNTIKPYGPPSNALVNYPWDAISLQPFHRLLDNDLSYIGKIINLAKPKSPKFSLLIYSRWPHKPAQGATAKVWDDLYMRKYTGKLDGTSETKDYFSRLTKAVRAKYGPSTLTFMVPVGQVFQALNIKMANGKVPGYSSIWDVYKDSTHVNNIGSYIVGLTYYATIFKSNPHSLAVPFQYGNIPKNVVLIIQDTVWNTVINEPLSGVKNK